MRIAMLALHTSPLAAPGGYKTGGMNVYVRELSRELARTGATVDIFTRRTTGDEPAIVELEDGARVIHVNSIPLDADSLEVASANDVLADEIVAWAHRNGVTYDAIHSHYWVSGAVGICLSRRWALPHVTMFHTLGRIKNQMRPEEPESEQRIAYEEAIIHNADRVVCATEQEAELIEELHGAGGERLAVIPCGVDLKLFHPGDRAAARLSLGLPSSTPLLLYVGRIEPLKGIDLLISALAMLKPAGGEEQPQLLVLGGDERTGDEVAELRRLAEELGVADRVRFMGLVGHQTLPLYYNAADVCVIPSQYESFGLVAVESMACGTPVVASRVGGLISTVNDEETGFLVPSRHPEAIAERIAMLLSNEQRRAAMGAKARRSVERFGWDSVTEEILNLYRDVLASGERAGTL